MHGSFRELQMGPRPLVPVPNESLGTRCLFLVMLVWYLGARVACRLPLRSLPLLLATRLLPLRQATNLLFLLLLLLLLLLLA